MLTFAPMVPTSDSSPLPAFGTPNAWRGSDDDAMTTSFLAGRYHCCCRGQQCDGARRVALVGDEHEFSPCWGGSGPGGHLRARGCIP